MRLRKFSKTLLRLFRVSEKLFWLSWDPYVTQKNSKDLTETPMRLRKIPIILLRLVRGLEKFQRLFRASDFKNLVETPLRLKKFLRPLWDSCETQKNSKDLVKTPPQLIKIPETLLRPLHASEKFLKPFRDFHETPKNSKTLLEAQKISKQLTEIL